MVVAPHVSACTVHTRCPVVRTGAQLQSLLATEVPCNRCSCTWLVHHHLQSRSPLALGAASPLLSYAGLRAPAHAASFADRRLAPQLQPESDLMACLMVHLAGASRGHFIGLPLSHPAAQLQLWRWWEPTICAVQSACGKGVVGRGNVGNKLRAQYCPISSTDVTTAIQFPRVTTTTSVDSFQDVQPILEQRALVPLRSHSLRHAVLDEEIWAAAWLRAQTYMEDEPQARYIESHKRKFAEQEFTALKRRVCGKVGQSIKCICFIAVMDTTTQIGDITKQVDPILHTVIGTVDISCREFLPAELSLKASRRTCTRQVSGVLGLRRHAYLSNLCVSKTARRNGVASNLLRAGCEVAIQWGLRDIYVHVLPNNLGAQRLYAKHNFHRLQTGLSEMSSTEPLLLCRSL